MKSRLVGSYKLNWFWVRLQNRELNMILKQSSNTSLSVLTSSIRDRIRRTSLWPNSWTSLGVNSHAIWNFNDYTEKIMTSGFFSYWLLAGRLYFNWSIVPFDELAWQDNWELRWSEHTESRWAKWLRYLKYFTVLGLLRPSQVFLVFKRIDFFITNSS